MVSLPPSLTITMVNDNDNDKTMTMIQNYSNSPLDTEIVQWTVAHYRLAYDGGLADDCTARSHPCTIGPTTITTVASILDAACNIYRTIADS